MEQWRNDTDRVKSKYSKKKCAPVLLFYRKFHVDWPGIEPVPQRRDAAD
jgi:hypothetical protein